MTGATAQRSSKVKEPAAESSVWNPELQSSFSSITSTLQHSVGPSSATNASRSASFKAASLPPRQGIQRDRLTARELPVHFCEQPEPDDKDPRGGHHEPMTHRFSEVKCPKCGWVHVAIPMDVARENSDTDEDLERYLKCFRCGAPTLGFVPALEGDAPMGCTLQAVVLTASD